MDWDNLRVFLEIARSETLVQAARRLGMDHSTVSRRLRRFEQQLGSQLFERNNQGAALTPQGYQLLEYARQMESTLQQATEHVAGHDRQLFGRVRIGATEGFGSYVLAPLLAHFCHRHPQIAADVLPVPRFVNLSKHEADVAISIERPQSGPYIVSKLTDYRLGLYATAGYLERHAPIRQRDDLAAHALIGYADDLLFSEELRYLGDIAPCARLNVRSSSVIAQFTAAQRGFGLAVLPCFLASHSDSLLPVLAHDVQVVRQFWIVAPQERRHLARVAALWDYLRAAMDANRPFMMGDTRDMDWPDDAGPDSPSATGRAQPAARATGCTDSRT